MTAEQLRNSILQEAISGRLVPQDPNDEPAKVIFEETQKERLELLSSKEIRKSDLVVSDLDEEQMFDLPEGWEWTTVDRIAIVKGGKRIPVGKTFSPTPTPYMYIRVTEMKNNTLIDCEHKYISAELRELLKRYIIHSTDIYVTIAGTIGAVGDVPEIFDGMNLTENALKLSHLHMDKKFLIYALSSPFVQEQFKEKTNKVGQPKLAMERVKNTMFPLPPLDEQKRIVAKLEELLPIVEQYGKAQKELDELNAALPARLRQSILQEAISGRLVPQDPNDEPIAKMLNTFGVKTIESEEDTPAGWSRIRMGEATEFINGLAFKPEEWKEAGLPIVRIQNLSNPHQPLHYTDKEIPEKFIIDDGQLLFSWSATLDAFIWNRGKACLNQHIFKLVPQPFIDKIYLYYLLKAIVEEYKKVTHGSTMKHITKGIFENYEILLPPLAEQQRIVAKIEELFEQINRLSETK